MQKTVYYLALIIIIALTLFCLFYQPQPQPGPEAISELIYFWDQIGAAVILHQAERVPLTKEQLPGLLACLEQLDVSACKHTLENAEETSSLPPGTAATVLLSSQGRSAIVTLHTRRALLVSVKETRHMLEGDLGDGYDELLAYLNAVLEENPAV